MMKIKLIKIIIFFPIIFFLGSCNDPIFFKVHEESPVLKPFIDGSPANFVEYNSKLYVASAKKIFSYSNNRWSEWKKLGDFVMCLAATEASSPANSSLYALYLDNNNGRVRRFFNNGNSSEDLNTSYNVQSIHASGNILFVSVRNNDTYTIYYLNEDSPSGLNEIAGTNSASKLYGVASDDAYYYLCTYSGIFCVLIDPVSLSAQSDVLGSSLGFTGIIKLNDDYSAAVCNNGDLYEINNAAITKVASFNDSRYSTGALALWYRNIDDLKPSLLLVGRKEYHYSTDTGYSNGYVEIELDTATGGIKSGAGFNEPGKNALSSIDNNDRYVSSLGKKPVNHIIQTPAHIDGNMTLFASTQQDGVWSYRDRGNGMTWNAEQ
jgi:hypothetical protein